MGWVEDLQGKTVAIDTSPLIYFIEKHPKYVDILRSFFRAVHEGKCQIITSTVTLLEVLVHPIKHEDEALAQRYNDILLSSPNVRTFAVTHPISQVAAELRAEYGLKTPDAIQVATAKCNGADAFLTNDRDMSGVEGVKLLKLRDLA